MRPVGAAVIALLASSMLAAGGASAAKLTLSEDGSALAPGAFVEMFGYDAISYEPSDGYLQCGEDFTRTEMQLSVTTNAAGRDELQLESFFEGNQEVCESFTGNAVTDLGVGGPVDLRAGGKATTGAARLYVEYEHIEGEHDVECIYTAKHLKGANTATPTRQQLALEFGGKLTLTRRAATTPSTSARRRQKWASRSR